MRLIHESKCRSQRLRLPFLLLLLVRIIHSASAFCHLRQPPAKIAANFNAHINVNSHHRRLESQLRWIKERQQATEYITDQLELVTAHDSCTRQEQLRNGPMRIVPPAATRTTTSTTTSSSTEGTDSLAINVLHAIDSTLRDKEVRQSLNQLFESGNGESAGVRQIQAGRFEVFLRLEDFDPASSGSGNNDQNRVLAFDWLAAKAGAALGGMSSEQIKDIIIGYAERQANSIPQYRSQGFIYHNFSLLISYDECFQQYPHIDMLPPNAQFGLVVTDDTPGTIWFEPMHSQVPITSAYELHEVWSDGTHDNNGDGGDVDHCKWVGALNNNPKVRSLLRRFGNVLSPDLQPNQPNQGTSLQTGTLMALPGGVVHAGPSCKDFRCVLFFSGYPSSSSSSAGNDNGSPVSSPYDPNLQYFGSMLLSDLIAATWTEQSVDDRQYLLERLVQYLEQPPVENRRLHKHLKMGSSMYEFAGFIETGLLQGDEREQYVRDFARNEDIQL